MRPCRQLLVLAAVFASSVAVAATSVPAHRVQAGACRAAFARASAAAHDDAARSSAAEREEDCLVTADDAVLPALTSHAAVDAEHAEELDAPNATQTYRDASAGFCAVLTEKNGSLEGHRSVDRVQCTADRESELARLVDEYAAGGGGPTIILSGASSCDDSLKAAHAPGDSGAWTTFEGCATAQANAKVSALVPKAAMGDPLAALGHSPEQIAMTLSRTFDAGKGICEVLAATHATSAQRELVRARCRAAAVANVSKAVGEHTR